MTNKIDFPMLIDQIPRYFKNPRACDIMFSTCGEYGFNYEHGKTVNDHAYSHDIAIKKSDTHYRIKHNGNTLFEITNSSSSGRFVGIKAEKGNFYFDNIALITEKEPNFTENFHWTGFRTLNERPEVSVDYFEQLRRGGDNWWRISGKWKETKDGFEALAGIPNENHEAKIVFGNYFWKNYPMFIEILLISFVCIGISRRRFIKSYPFRIYSI